MMELSKENQLALVVSTSRPSVQELLDRQRELVGSQIDQLQYIVGRQCKLTGVNPLSQEMAAGALSIKIGKRPRDLLSPKAIKCMQLIFSIKDDISKKDSREISALFGVTATQGRKMSTTRSTRSRKSREDIAMAIATKKRSRKSRQQVENQVVQVSASTTSQKGRILYRCSMQLLIQQVKSLKFTRDQLKALEKTPFWNIIDRIRNGAVVEKNCVKNDNIIKSIVSCYVKGERCFKFGEREMELQPRDAKLIFGINDGEHEINISVFKFERSDFVQRCFPEKMIKGSENIRLRPKLICDRIKEMIQSRQQEDVNCVASLTTLLVLATFFVTSKTSYIPWAYTSLISDLDTISTYNWSKHIVDLLLDSLESAEDGYVERCVLLLPYWLCERSQILRPIYNTYIPRFVKWNLSDLSKTLNASNFASFVNNQNFFNVLTTTRREKKELRGTTMNELELLSEVAVSEIEGGLITDEMNLIEVAVDGFTKDDYIAFCLTMGLSRDETESVTQTPNVEEKEESVRTESEGVTRLIKRKKS